MNGLLSKGDRIALRGFDFDQASGRGARVMSLSRMREQLKAVAMGRNHFADASNQVPVWSESTTRKQGFELLDNRIKLANEPWNLIDRMCRIRHAGFPYLKLSPVDIH